MALGVRLPSGTVVNMEDLPLVEWEGIAVAGGLEVREWPLMAMSPGGYPKGAMALLAVCARHVKEDVPPDDYLTLGNLAEVFHSIEDDLPAGSNDGVPDPKAEADLTTT